MQKGTRHICVRGTLLGDEHPCDILVDGSGIVRQISGVSKSPADIGGDSFLIAPTLFDIQVNGAFGIDLQDDAVKAEDVLRLSDFLARQGISMWVPTLITAPHASLLRRCRLLGELMQDRCFSASVPGIHLEGPYISPLDGPRGAHEKAFVRKPDLREFERLYKATGERILYVTVAPEMDGAIPFIRAVTRMGVVVALGHHAAEAECIQKAVDAGARLCTHLGNGMASQIHRHHNPLWAQLANDQLTASLIADLEHLPQDVLKTFVRAKGPRKVILTSDVVHLAGLPAGAYSLLGVSVELKKTGRICLSGTDLLAGSSLMLLQGVFNAARATDLSLKQAFDCATRIPCRFFNLRKHYRPVVGKKADFILLNVQRRTGGDMPKVVAVFINGERKR